MKPIQSPGEAFAAHRCAVRRSFYAAKRQLSDTVMVADGMAAQDAARALLAAHDQFREVVDRPGQRDERSLTLWRRVALAVLRTWPVSPETLPQELVQRAQQVNADRANTEKFQHAH